MGNEVAARADGDASPARPAPAPPVTDPADLGGESPCFAHLFDEPTTWDTE